MRRRPGRNDAALLVVALTLLSACGASPDPDSAGGWRRQPATTTAEDGTGAEVGRTPGTAAGTPATGTSATGRAEAGDRASFYLAAADQASDGRSVAVEEVTLAGGPGWVVVHSSVNGDRGPVIGWSERKLPAGTSRNVTAVLTRPVVASAASVYVMVHLDTDGNETFDYPGTDGPASLPGGGEAMVRVRLTIR